MSKLSWDKVQTSLKNNIGERLYTTWLEATSFEGVDETPTGKVFRIGVPGPIYKDSIEENLIPEIEHAVKDQVSTPFRIEIVISAKGGSTAAQPQQEDTYSNYVNKAQLSAQQPHRDIPQAPAKHEFLHPEYTFGTFVVGQDNQVAHAACFSVSENPGKVANPLFVCGPSGVGKTHLLNALGNSIKGKNPNFKVLFLSGENFLNDYVASIRHAQMDKFRKRFRESCDLLVVDDIHILAKKESVQEEFFHTFNSLHEQGKQLVFSSDKFPREIEGLEDRIRTRLEWGLTVDIQTPDVETRMAILRYKSEKTGLFLPDNVVSLIAQISKKSVRELEGHLATLRMYSELKGVPITFDFAKEVLSKFMTSQKKSVGIEDIQRVVGNSFGVTIKDLRSSSRVKTLVQPRQIAMFLCRKFLDLGVAEIGRGFGGRDHTTVLHSLTKVQNSLATDEELMKQISEIEKKINNSEDFVG